MICAGEMWIKHCYVALALSVILPLVQTDLPSCYRARCTHCSVVFIAQMCPSTCASCYGTDPQRIPTGPRIRAGNANYKPVHLASGSSFLPTQPRIHGQAISNTGPSHHSISSQTSVRHGVFSSPTANEENQNQAASSQANKAPLAQSLPAATAEGQQPIVQPQPQYHHQFTGAIHQVSSNTGPQTPSNIQLPQYPAVGSQPANVGQPTAFGSSYAPAAAVPPAQYSAQAQPIPNEHVGLNSGQNQVFGQPQYFGQQPQVQQPNTLFGQQQQPQSIAQQASPQTFSQGGFAQPFGQQPGAAVQQPGSSPFANPFQPFLQQSYAAQQQQPFYQPYTVAIPAPFVTLAPVAAPQTYQGLAANNQGQQLPQTLPQNQAGYAQQGQVGTGGAFGAPPPSPSVSLQIPEQQSQQPLANSQYTYGPQASIDSQRPKQIYNNGAGYLPAQQSGEPLSVTSAPSQPVAVGPAKPYRFSAVPTTVVTASNSIDPTAMYVNKNGYAEKSGGAFPQPTTCSKHPNWEPCISKELANQRFNNCCQRLGDGCSQLCSYDQTLTVLQLAVLTGRCPIGKVADMMICASGYEDATACCQAHNVFEMGYEHCRPYCNPAAGLPNDGMLSEKYRCLGKLTQIQRCFYVLQKP